MKKSGYQLVNEIEGSYPVEKILYKDTPVWLLLKGYLYFKLTQGVSKKIELTRKDKLNIILSSIKKNLNFFIKSDAWFYGITIDRVLIDNKYFDKYIDLPASMFKKSLIVEIPFFNHYKKSETCSKKIASKSFLIILEKIYTKLFLRSNEIQNEEILKEILLKYDADFNYYPLAKKMYAQYRVMKFILKFNTPKYVFFGTSYTNYGYIKAFREKEIKIFEIQHGVIHNEHFGYFVRAKFDESFFPDKLLTFGNREIDVFKDPFSNGIKANNVFPVGNFYLEYIYENFKKNHDLVKRIQKYKKVFSVSLQDSPIGDQLVPIIIELSNQLNDYMFLMKRRARSLESYNEKYSFGSNIFFVEDLNVYEIIMHSHLHITAYSSCVLEAPALGVKNLIINIENYANLLFGNVLNENTSDFVDGDIFLLKKYLLEFEPFKVSPEKIRENHSDVISPGYKENFKKFLDENIDSNFTY